MQGGLAKNDSNEAGFQSLQISRSDLLDETQFVATANDRRLDPTDPKNTQRVRLDFEMMACLRKPPSYWSTLERL
jgi:hypothetical protein